MHTPKYHATVATLLLKKDPGANLEAYQSMVGDVHAICQKPKGRLEKVTVEVLNADGEVEVKETTAGRALVLSAVLIPFVFFGRVPPASFFELKHFSSKLFDKLINQITAELYDEPIEELNYVLSGMMSFIGDAGISALTLTGVSVSVKSIFEAADLNPRVWEIINWKIPPYFTPEEVENTADSLCKELLGILSSLPGDFGRLIRSGAAINEGQFRQGLVSIGMKPALLPGQLIPEPVDANYFRGLDSINGFMTSAIGARKALITNFYQVSTSGYLTRKMILLLISHTLSKKVASCGTKHGIKVTIQSEDHARRLFGRQVMLDDDPGVWMEPDDNFFLENVGSSFTLRSPTKCASKYTCHSCYGRLATRNSDIHIGIYAILVIFAQLLQRLLSSKHLLRARPMAINWPEGLLDYFSLERTALWPESTVERVVIRNDDLAVDETLDGERSTSTIYLQVDGSDELVCFNLPTPLVLNTDVWDSADQEAGELSIAPPPDEPLFTVIVGNTDLAQALYNIFALFETDKNENIDEMYARMIALLEEGAITTPSVHAEMIMRALIRKPDDHSTRPDFSVLGGEPESVILKLPQAIMSSPSLSNSLAFEKVASQLRSIGILNKRESTLLDAVFGFVEYPDPAAV